MSALRQAISVSGLMLLWGNVAVASSGHYDSGHLAVMALAGGAIALGSSALGGYVGGSASAKRDRHDGAAEREAEAASSLDLNKVATTASDYAAKLVKDSSPRGGAIDAAYTVAKSAVTDTDPAAGMADGLGDLATAQIKEAVKGGAAEGLAAPSGVTRPAAASAPVSGPVGTTARFCRDCGTPTREGARFCASCGRKLG